MELQGIQGIRVEGCVDLTLSGILRRRRIDFIIPFMPKSAAKPAKKPAVRTVRPRSGISAGVSAYSEAEILALARPSIQALKPYVPGRSIEDVRAQYEVKRVVKLGSNENPLGTSPKALKAARAALAKSSLYPDGASRTLRRDIASHCGTAVEEIVVGNGSDEILLNIALAFVKVGEKVVISENTFSEYEFSGRVLGAEIVKIPLRDMRYDLAGFAKALSQKPKMLFLCNPNNPTGTYFTHTELLALLEKTPRTCLVVVDEAYGDYATAPDFPRCIELMRTYPNLLVARTFSKLYGLAGLRLGYGIGDAGLLRETLRVKTPFNVNLVVQAAASAALTDKAFVKKSLSVNVKGRAQIEAGLKKLGLPFLPTQGNFICFKVPCQAIDLCEDLLERGMIIRALKSFGLPEWCRVTIGTAEQNRFFLAELQKVL
jgi:histidinol-phosphate aminotransferase